MRLRDRSRVFKPKPKSCVTSPMTNTGRKDRVRDRKRRWPLSIFDMSKEIVCRTSRFMPFLNEKELSTSWHSCALRLPALFLDTHEGCINLLLSRLAAGCSLGLAKSKMHARARKNKTGQRMHASTHIMLSCTHIIEDSTGKRQSFHILSQEWYCFRMRHRFKSCCGKVRHDFNPRSPSQPKKEHHVVLPENASRFEIMLWPEATGMVLLQMATAISIQGATKIVLL